MIAPVNTPADWGEQGGAGTSRAEADKPHVPPEVVELSRAYLAAKEALDALDDAKDGVWALLSSDSISPEDLSAALDKLNIPRHLIF